MSRQRTTDHSIDRWSAGGVVLRTENDGRLSVALCHRRAESLWALPKGTPEQGESVADTALREVTEETGLQVEIGPPIDDTSIHFLDRPAKRSANCNSKTTPQCESIKPFTGT